MLPFDVLLTPGESPYRQVVFAATKAVVAGRLTPGTPFPSVRELSQALRINPNTAHKVVQELVRQGVLQVLPGVGTVVASAPPVDDAGRRALLSTQVEQLVVEARRLGIDEHEVLEAVAARWRALSGGHAVAPGEAAQAAARATDRVPARATDAPRSVLAPHLPSVPATDASES